MMSLNGLGLGASVQIDFKDDIKASERDRSGNERQKKFIAGVPVSRAELLDRIALTRLIFNPSMRSTWDWSKLIFCQICYVFDLRIAWFSLGAIVFIPVISKSKTSGTLFPL